MPREAIAGWENAFKSLLSAQTSTAYQPPSVTSNNNEVTSYSHSVEIPISEDLIHQLILSKSRKLERHLVLMESHVKS